MSRRRERRKEEKATFGRKGTAARYQMRQKLVAFGDDFYIKNEAGQNVFKVEASESRTGFSDASRRCQSGVMGKSRL